MPRIKGQPARTRKAAFSAQEIASVGQQIAESSQEILGISARLKAAGGREKLGVDGGNTLLDAQRLLRSWILRAEAAMIDLELPPAPKVRAITADQIPNPKPKK